MNNWISVENDLPEGTQVIASYSDDVLCTDGVSIFIGFLARTPNYPSTWYHRDEESHCRVTHWLPLPKIPKGKYLTHEEVFGHVGTELNLKEAAEYLEMSESELYNLHMDYAFDAELLFKVEDLKRYKKGWKR